MINLNTQKRNLDTSQHANLRTVHTCEHIIVHNCRTQHGAGAESKLKT